MSTKKTLPLEYKVAVLVFCGTLMQVIMISSFDLQLLNVAVLVFCGTLMQVSSIPILCLHTVWLQSLFFVEPLCKAKIVNFMNIPIWGCSPCFLWNPYASIQYRPMNISNYKCCSPCFLWNPYASSLYIPLNQRERLLQSLFFVEPLCKTERHLLVWSDPQDGCSPCFLWNPYARF